METGQAGTLRFTSSQVFTPRIGRDMGWGSSPRDIQCVLITKSSFSMVPPPHRLEAKVQVTLGAGDPVTSFPAGQGKNPEGSLLRVQGKR